MPLSWFLPGLANAFRASSSPERSLAERIGYSADDRLLIVNCDDFGCSRSANRAIERALREGSATSASLMVPCPWAKSAAKASHDLDIGIHLTLTSEYPDYRWSSVSGARSLHDRDGYLPKTVREVWSRAEPGDIELECSAQINQALEWGVDVTHLNSHMNILEINREYFDIYMRLAKRYKLPLRLSWRSSLPFSRRSRSVVELAGIPTADRYFAPPWGEPARNGLFSRIRNLASGITEVALHPAEDGKELRAYDTEYADIRVDDADCLMTRRLKYMIGKHGVRLIGFRPLREAMRAHTVAMEDAYEAASTQEPLNA